MDNVESPINHSCVIVFSRYGLISFILEKLLSTDEPVIVSVKVLSQKCTHFHKPLTDFLHKQITGWEEYPLFLVDMKGS